MKKSSLKKKSHRQSLSVKYKVDKKVRQHYKRLRKEARRATKNGIAVKKPTQKTKIPNLYPNKKIILEEEDLKKEIAKLEKKRNGKKGITDVGVEDLDNLVEVGKENEIIEQKEKGQVILKSKYDFKRHLNEIIEKSDIILNVLDAREPLAFVSKEMLKQIEKNKKQIILILNKVDLISEANRDKWFTLLRREHPILTNSKNETNFEEKLIDLIKQFDFYKKSNKLRVGIVGYPNTGKNTILSSITKHKLMNASKDIPNVDECQLDSRTFIYNVPGTIFAKNDSFAMIPKSFKEISECQKPIEIVNKMLLHIPEMDLVEFYEISSFANTTEFLLNLCKKFNHFIKGGHPDLERSATKVVEDVVTGKLKFETKPEN